MSALIDPDLKQAASYRHMIAHLAGPLASGAVDTALPIDPTGRVTVAWQSREPLLLVAPIRPLRNGGLRLTATLNPGSDNTSLPAVTFAPYTEVGAFLPLHRPEVNGDTRTAAPFTVGIELIEVASDGTETPVAPVETAARVEVRLLEGVMGRMLYLLGAEKARLRRQAREVAAMRFLSTARDNALDRMGAALGVPRFVETLDFREGTIVTRTQREADEAYRRRLGLYRGTLIPNRKQVVDLLNGPGANGDPNRGLLSQIGVISRFQVLEADNAFAVAIHLVASGDGALRDSFLSYIRTVHLTWPANDIVANRVHADRFLPTKTRDQIRLLRAGLRESFIFERDMAIAPMLAAVLDRVGRCRRELGLAAPWPILRAHEAGAGSRYELGLGVDVPPMSAAELEAMADRLRDDSRPPAADPEVEGILQSMKPQPVADDTEGCWFLKPCGLRTVHRIDTDRVYLSHFPTFGLAISGGSVAAPAGLSLEVRYHAPGDPGSNAALAAGLTAGHEEWTAGGGPAWEVLSDADARNRWAHANARPADDPALLVLDAAGLPAIEEPASIVERLDRLPDELIKTLRLAPAQAARIATGSTAAADELRHMTAILRDHGLVSVLPLVTDTDEVLIVVGVIGLPQAGINLSDRRATGFRWYVVPIVGAGGHVKPIGSRTEFVPEGPGLSAVVVIGYARRGLTDPYEYRVELPEDTHLDLLQYEFLMNALDHAHPAGIEINTFSIRQSHVDLDGDGAAEPLDPSVARTFRPFRRRRFRGETQEREF